MMMVVGMVFDGVVIRCGKCGKRMSRRSYQLLLGSVVDWVCGDCYKSAFLRCFRADVGVRKGFGRRWFKNG